MRVNVSASEVRVRTVPAASNPPGKLIDNPIGVMFSGGMDSTLTAAVLADRFRNIHLVTYGMGRQLQFMSNALYHVHELKKILGEDRIHHEFVDNNEIFSELKKGFIRDYVEYCNNKAPFIHCLKCKFSMHARSIIYCLENGLKYWADGAIEAQNDRPEMMPGVLKLLEGLYAQYGIELSSPVYYYGSRDDERRELVRRGYTLGLQTGDLHKTVQPLCLYGIMYAYWHYSATPSEKDVVRFAESKLPLASKLIRQYFERKGHMPKAVARVPMES